MSRLTTIAVSLVALLSLAPGMEAADQTFVVSGTLVRDDKSLVEGARVMIAEPKNNGFALSIGGTGQTENPSAVTDAKGRFSITVSRSLFKDRREFVVVVPLFAKTPAPVVGRSTTVRIDAKTRNYKLGKIRHDSPIVR